MFYLSIEGVQMTRYLTPEDLADLLAKENAIKQGVLSVSDFKDTSDRTLTLGFSGSINDPSKRLYEHIYLEGGQLRRHAYSMDGPSVYTKIQTAAEGMHILLLRPTLGTSPSATDLEFAKLMESFHHSLKFFKPGSKEDKVLSENRVDGKFFGWRQKYYFENGNSTLY
jgi:hypothetical protein